MPILHMGQDGEIYEVDSTVNNSSAVGRVAEYVEDDDVLKLSEKQDPQVLADRKKIDELKKKRTAHALLGQLRKAAAINRKVKIEEEKEAQKLLKLKQAQARVNEKKAKLYQRAIQSGKQDIENMVGVSGNGYTADGRRPYIDFPPQDWDMFEDVQETFGSSSGAVLVSSQEEDERVVMTPDVSEDLNDFTDVDRMIISQFEANSFPIKIRSFVDGEYYPEGDYVMVVDQSWRQNIRSNNQYYVRPGEIDASLKRGWMWSGFHDENGDFVNVKVPLIRGIPQDDPGDERQDGYYRQTNREQILSGSEKTFDAFKPVILAYAKRFISEHGDESYSQDGITRADEAGGVKTTPAPSETQTSSDSVHQTMKPLEKALSGFAHPMLKKGWIPRKG